MQGAERQKNEEKWREPVKPVGHHQPQTHIMGGLGGRQGERSGKEFWRNSCQKSHNLVKYMDLHIQEAQWTSARTNTADPHSDTL